MKPVGYLTIEKPATGSFKSKGSRFLSFAYPVEKEAEIQKILTSLRKEHFDARHHCFAWRLGTDSMKYRANDDGEPTHSAGKPILGQIQAFGLTNILVVVVRYFGGTLLGVGGLIQAYKAAAMDALNKTTIKEKFLTGKYRVSFPYSATNLIMKVVKQLGTEPLFEPSGSDCCLYIELKESLEPDLYSLLGRIDGLTIESSGEPYLK